MATLYIEEYAHLGRDEHGALMPVPGLPIAVQKVAVGAVSAQSVAFNAATRYLILTTDTVCQWETGNTSPTADGESLFLPANTPRAFAVQFGALWELAVIDQQ